MNNFRFFINILSHFIDIFIIFIFIKPKNFLIKDQSRNKIVGIIKIDGLGDYIIWKNAIQSLIKFYKDNDFKVVGIFESSSAELANIDEDFDEIIPINKFKFYSIFYRLRLFKMISQKGMSEIISITFSNIIGSPHNSISYASNAKKISTISQYVSNNLFIGALRKVSNAIVFNNIIEVDTSNSIHEYVRSKNFIESLKIPLKVKNQNDFLNTDDLPSIINTYKNYILIVSDASSEEKCWPINKYLELSIELIRLNFNVVWAGQQNFTKDQEAILKNNNIINLTKKTTIREFVSIIKTSDLLVCNDSFPIHVAAFCGIRSICIYWGGVYRRFLPYPENSDRNIRNPEIQPSEFFFEGNLQNKEKIGNEVIANIAVSDILNLVISKNTNL